MNCKANRTADSLEIPVVNISLDTNVSYNRLLQMRPAFHVDLTN